MPKRSTLTLRRSSTPALPRLSLLDAAFVSILFTVAAASFLQIPIQALNPFKAPVVVREIPSRIVVWVQPTGRLDVNGRAVEKAGLAARLRELVALRPDLHVEVVARGAVEPRALVAALTAAKQAGARGVRVTRLDPDALTVTLSAADVERAAVTLADRT